MFQSPIVMPEWTATSVVIYLLIAGVCLASGFVERKALLTISYSKFRQEGGLEMDSRLGMLLIYFIPFLAHIPAVMLFNVEPLFEAQQLFSLAILTHFAKRCYEVLVVHKYSGPIGLPTVIQITAGYTAVSVYAAYLLPLVPTQINAIVIVGIIFFILGQGFNFYHHYLLAKLREQEEGYFIPHGGLFEKVSCPHYFFEVMAWIGIALISRHIDMFLLALMMGSYLTGRSVKATEWYREKFPDYPSDRKHIFPNIF